GGGGAALVQLPGHGSREPRAPRRHPGGGARFRCDPAGAGRARTRRRDARPLVGWRRRPADPARPRAWRAAGRARSARGRRGARSLAPRGRPRTARRRMAVQARDPARVGPSREAGPPRSRGLQRVPVFYGWILVATAFVTMGIMVNARTAFSLFFPAILDEFGWSRALTAATFTTGLLASNAVTPFMGVLMDRLGPRVVYPIGVGLTSAGLALATRASAPWQIHLTLGVLVAGGTVFVSYMGQSLLLPNWFVRQRGLALGIAFSGVGVGS